VIVPFVYSVTAHISKAVILIYMVYIVIRSVSVQLSSFLNVVILKSKDYLCSPVHLLPPSVICTNTGLFVKKEVCMSRNDDSSLPSIFCFQPSI
jgi:hypothetical protein